MNDTPVRFKQRFTKYSNALTELESFVKVGNPQNKLEELGLIKAFECTYELGCKVLKDYLQLHGSQNVYDSRDAISEASYEKLIEDKDGWMNMFKDKCNSLGVLDQKTADTLEINIVNKHFILLQDLREKLEHLVN